jgi:hypothetical protein
MSNMHARLPDLSTRDLEALKGLVVACTPPDVIRLSLSANSVNHDSRIVYNELESVHGVESSVQ